MNYTKGRENICELPNEITSIILRCLDSRSLINAARVCKHWSRICRADPVLRVSIRKQRIKQKRMRWCRAKYGDGTLKRAQMFRGSKEVMLRGKYRMTQLLMTLIHIRNIWQGFYDSLLAL